MKTFNDQAVEIIRERSSELRRMLTLCFQNLRKKNEEIKNLKAEIDGYKVMLATRNVIAMDKDGILDGPNGVIGHWKWEPVRQ